VEETEEPVYGLTKPLNSHSFLWQHFHFLLEMAVAFKKVDSLSQKLKVVFGKPDNIDPRIRTLLEKKLLPRTEQVEQTLFLRRFIGTQTVLTLILLFFFVLFEHYFNGWQLLIGTIFILLSSISTGAMIEQKKWVFYLDFSRLTLIGAFVFSFYPSVFLLNTLIITLLVVLLYYRSIQNRYVQVLYNYA
jgi:hypothetical protein